MPNTRVIFVNTADRVMYVWVKGWPRGTGGPNWNSDVIRIEPGRQAEASTEAAEFRGVGVYLYQGRNADPRSDPTGWTDGSGRLIEGTISLAGNSPILGLCQGEGSPIYRNNPPQPAVNYFNRDTPQTALVNITATTRQVEVQPGVIRNLRMEIFQFVPLP